MRHGHWLPSLVVPSSSGRPSGHRNGPSVRRKPPSAEAVSESKSEIETEFCTLSSRRIALGWMHGKDKNAVLRSETR
ncbi:hypothetical protein STAFG_4579 [Streptomyces afghaniensis 772]|uniref:Uncharacterized protein n=1 Tax=Streptomyces afghaniensis 772 TaxID=1283301 RepID=S4NJ13_9ACTN|nr:hypothetical protein STAFG_4579 [Streptomyces afghaniensis 772]